MKTWGEFLNVEQVHEGAPPKDWNTMEQIVQEVGRSIRRCNEMVAAALKAGRAEKRLYRVKGRPVPHYRRK